MEPVKNKTKYADARKAYTRGFLTHSQFYDWLVSISGQSEFLKSIVRQSIGADRIKRSECDYFNDIPMRLWDNLDGVFREIVGRKIGCWSLSNTCSCAKELARQIKGEIEQ